MWKKSSRGYIFTRLRTTFSHGVSAWGRGHADMDYQHPEHKERYFVMV